MTDKVFYQNTNAPPKIGDEVTVTEGSSLRTGVVRYVATICEYFYYVIVKTVNRKDIHFNTTYENMFDRYRIYKQSPYTRTSV